METLLTLVALVVGLVNLICWIIVLTKLFPAEGALKGILGIICGLYALIWGWQNADRFNIRNIMLVWTFGIVIGIVLNLLLRGMVSY
jgi:hypothetical protein